ncbi:MAG: TRAP transporter large permease [candidate division NC10 bacterium]|nr:TRAP transporter large permease [candidate division NC10 bacterium]MBI2113785.1 TRAP transporter large permease [candidate division NC10 bacterium]MBI2455380.1 TRAP transporter large permease [candidate division NC10 bacterium]MBI3122154.1 TRAP transporter large permease [candidate division NC10 bacterium]
MAVTLWVVTFILFFLFRGSIALGMVVSTSVYFLAKGITLQEVVETMVIGFDNQFVLLAIPLFVLSARVMNIGGITTRIFNFADSSVGFLRGGLAHVNVVGSIIFSGMTGSALADASGLGLMEIKSMEDGGYERPFACAVSAATATIGPIIPPSIPMVIFSMLSGASLGNLFLGGVIPGLLMGGAMMGYIAAVARRRSYPVGTWQGFRALCRAFAQAFLSLMTPVILLGGIYSGVFTPTEAGAAAALYAMLLAVLVYRDMGLRGLYREMVATVENVGFLTFIIAGAFAFSYVVTLEGISNRIATGVVSMTTNPYVLLLLLNILFLILGCFLDTMILMLVVIPMILPAVRALGIDLVHFGVVIVLNMMIGLCTPPYGMLLFTVSGLTKTPLGLVIREVMPFLWVLITVLFLITYVPGLVLFLPRLVGFQS